MRSRKRGNKTYYYLDNNVRINRKLTPLGSNFAEALVKYAEYITPAKQASTIYTFNVAIERYFIEIVPTKAPRTQIDNNQQIKNLVKFFDKAPLEQIKPMHIRQYLDWRKEAPIRANREISLFSHIFNWSRQWGMTDKENPCLGNTKHKEIGRKDVYVSDADMSKILEYSDRALKNAIKLAYLTGQRPADVLKMKWKDVYTENNQDYIFVNQNKTKAKLSICISGELKELLSNISKNNETILGLTYAMLRKRFDKARELAGLDKNKFQFRDLRAKAGTDTANSKGLETAQKQLGHKNINMTMHYYRDEKGQKTEPTR